MGPCVSKEIYDYEGIIHCSPQIPQVIKELLPYSEDIRVMDLGDSQKFFGVWMISRGAKKDKFWMVGQDFGVFSASFFAIRNLREEFVDKAIEIFRESTDVAINLGCYRFFNEDNRWYLYLQLANYKTMRFEERLYEWSSAAEAWTLIRQRNDNFSRTNALYLKNQDFWCAPENLIRQRDRLSDNRGLGTKV